MGPARLITYAIGFVFLALACAESRADQLLIAQQSSSSPVIDGVADDDAWSNVAGIVTQDFVADIPLEVKAIHSGSSIYFLVRYPDPEKSPYHRSWMWNDDLDEYESADDREDVFVLKWFMAGNDSDLSLSSATGYSADIWFWKACRTDPVGYADDKIQRLYERPVEHCLQLVSKTGSNTYLSRAGDKGSPAYRTRVIVENEGLLIPRFESKQPRGSRADIRAKGQWVDGFWTIEFERKLYTGHDDDVQLDITRSYRFGVSRYEIAGREEEAEADQPLYGCGEISEIITLEFAQQEKDRAR
jgi:Ethylbenzene dehydrogenase